MTVTEPTTPVGARKTIKVRRSVIEGAKLQITLNRRLGLPVDPALVKIAAAKPAA